MAGELWRDGAPEGRPRAILFDAGNTLVFMDRLRVAAALEERGIGVDPNRLTDAEFDARRSLVERVSVGHVGTEPHLWRRYFLHTLRGSGVSLGRMPAAVDTIRTLHREEHLWTLAGEGVQESLRDVLDQGIRIGVISNADGRMEAAIERAGIRDHFEFVIDSDVVGMEKPDPRIFLEGCGRFGLDPRECAYVGDLYPVDVLGARNAGLRPVLLDPFGHQEVDALRVRSLSELTGPMWESRRPREGVV